MLLNGADYAPFSCSVGVFMAHSGRIYETTDFVVQLRGQVQFPGVNTGLLTEGLEVSFSGLKAKVRDRWNKGQVGAEFGRDEWFALYKDDWESMMVLDYK